MTPVVGAAPKPTIIGYIRRPGADRDVRRITLRPVPDGLKADLRAAGFERLEDGGVAVDISPTTRVAWIELGSRRGRVTVKRRVPNIGTHNPSADLPRQLATVLHEVQWVLGRWLRDAGYELRFA